MEPCSIYSNPLSYLPLSTPILQSVSNHSLQWLSHNKVLIDLKGLHCSLYDRGRLLSMGGGGTSTTKSASSSSKSFCSGSGKWSRGEKATAAPSRGGKQRFREMEHEHASYGRQTSNLAAGRPYSSRKTLPSFPPADFLGTGFPPQEARRKRFYYFPAARLEL